MAGVAAGIAGRAAEIAALMTVAHDAARGAASTMLVVGEAGVGKTALVRQACRDAGNDVEIVWVSCLPLASPASPLLPLRSVLPGASIMDGADPVLRFDSWLDRSAARHPLVLVVDDVQWADDSTSDLLSNGPWSCSTRRPSSQTLKNTAGNWSIQSREPTSAPAANESGLGSSADGKSEEGIDRSFQRTGTPLHLGEE